MNWIFNLSTECVLVYHTWPQNIFWTTANAICDNIWRL